ncbi:helix-turn-helix transcriptional regulator [Octadecabacter sp. 1_MG-2023]|uniref:helix-turn-helix domain-containing protein n=1 Tax=unclassified Octadecabacter TaxID=196158 RepID=UPI001C0A3FE4|nr:MULTISPECIES: helix-turn-helix transcriptional regulator [unclassified Octadecabacter]MBU2992805.1 helix-turn-helix domain-containing protein [Octadecabacter sp. B2R22]MDO6733744.1 helix-turn-helix transcriptional regulator [Octadecabacter sp. 1_MG-2023]
MTDADDNQDWYSEETATFGDRLAAAREAAKLSQKGLAQRVGVKNSTMRNWENDLSEPRANRLSILAGILGVSLSWLLTGEGEGVEAPEEEDQLAPDMTVLLTELRSVRAQMAVSAERLALLEKRFRAVGKS